MLDAVVNVFAAAEAPVNWNLIENFEFSNQQCRDKLKNNEYLLVGNLIKDETKDYIYKTPFYKHLDLFVSRNPKNLS
jgi:hypothetical protein